MDYDAEINKLKKEIDKTLQRISEKLLLRDDDDLSIGHLQLVIDELDDHVKMMYAKLYTAWYLGHQKTKKENGKENE